MPSGAVARGPPSTQDPPNPVPQRATESALPPLEAGVVGHRRLAAVAAKSPEIQMRLSALHTARPSGESVESSVAQPAVKATLQKTTERATDSPSMAQFW